MPCRHFQNEENKIPCTKILSKSKELKMIKVDAYKKEKV
jgi:hypothetical protein